LLAARADLTAVNMEMFEKAQDKIMMGAERRTMVMSEDDKRLTAYHEAGHTIVGRLMPEHDPVHKVSIIPRGRALGVTLFLPEKDRYSASKRLLESQLSSLYGGRIAEELVFGADKVTTGAQNDIERATQIARNMVMRWGLSEKMGPLAYEEEEGEVFLGRSVTQHKNISDATSKQIEQEVRMTVDRNYQRAKDVLVEHRDKLDAMAEALMQYETLNSSQIDDIMEGRPVRPPAEDRDGDLPGPTARAAEGKREPSSSSPGGVGPVSPAQ
jgi:cell division protease FtsH